MLNAVPIVGNDFNASIGAPEAREIDGCTNESLDTRPLNWLDSSMARMLDVPTCVGWSIGST